MFVVRTASVVNDLNANWTRFGRCSAHAQPKELMAATTVADVVCSQQTKLAFQFNKFYAERVQARRVAVSKALRDVCKVVQDVLKEVETQEPRFISSLTEINGHYEGLQVSHVINTIKVFMKEQYCNVFSTLN
jgi:hypothetical protein